jgi:5-methylcytosine-specific restriction protein A
MIQGTVATFYLIPPDALEEIVQQVRGASVGTGLAVGPGEIDEQMSSEEGAQLLQMHLSRERDPRLVKVKKQQVLKRAGRLECEVCGFDFVRTYGSHGHGVCEVHRCIPLSERPNGSFARLGDLTIVCANCHRILHQSTTLRSLEIVRRLLR